MATLGRPSERTAEIEEEILRDLSLGLMLTEICRRDHMPTRGTVYEWARGDTDFFDRFTRARELGREELFEQSVEIADDGVNDYETRQNKAGGDYEAFNPEHVQRSKLRIWTRLEMLARLDPKRYGQRQQIAPVTPEGDAAAFAPIMFVPVEAKPQED